MKKWIMLFISFAFLAGCAQSAGPTSAPVIEPTSIHTSSNQGTLSFIVFGDPAEVKAYQDLATAFETRYPGAKVDLITIPGQSDYRTRVAADFAAGTPADVVLMNYRRFAPFAAKGSLEPLDSYLSNSQVISPQDFYPAALEAFTWQGKTMCIPQNLSSLVVYYNKSLFDQANLPYPQNDWTWDDFLKDSQTLTRDVDGDGQMDQFGVGFEGVLARFAPFIWQHGGEVTNNDIKPTALALDWPLSKEAITWVTELQTKHHVMPNAEQEASEDSESRFMNGRLGMYLNSRRVVPDLRQSAAFDWDVAPLPRDEHIASVLHSDGYCMSASAKDKNLVWKFIEFANSPVGQQIVAANGRTVPSLKSVAESPAFLDPNQKPANNQAAFLDMAPYIRALPGSVGWVEVEEIVDQELTRALYGETSVDEAIQTANQLAQPNLVETETP
jgi:multiple sugar transport system substrate-binding protein